MIVASVHGLRVSTELPAEGLRAAPADGPIDVVVTRREPGPADGRRDVIARFGAGGGYVVEQGEADCRVTFPDAGVAAFVDPGGGTIAVEAGAGVADELAGILAHGHALALLLALRGKLVLHASAVALAGRTVAFAGGGGAGKTTLAALACAAGWELVADDALRVAPGARCWPGHTELRLRPDALDEGAVPALPRRATVDGRIALRPAVVADAERGLDALVVPSLAAELRAPSLDRRHPADAAMDLMRLSRVTSWTAPAPLAAQFEVASKVAAGLPVFVARLPAHPSRSPDLAVQILEHVGAALA